MTFTAIVCSHNNPYGLVAALNGLLTQTRKPDEVLVLASNMPEQSFWVRDPDPPVAFVPCENMNDWGHAKRAEGITLAASEWVGFFNDDDSVAPTFVEKLLAAGKGKQAAYCLWNEAPIECHFAAGSSTSGNFIFRRAAALQVGYVSRAYEADGVFIDALRRRVGDAQVGFVPEVLFARNVQPFP